MADKLKSVRLDEIWVDDEFNCRGVINPVDAFELAKDIKARGLINPVSVMEIEEKDKAAHPDKKYKLLAGFCRMKAHEINESDMIQCIIRSSMSEIDAIAFNLNENDKRTPLNIMQEARAIKHLFDLHLTENEIMAALGKTRGWVQPRVMLLKMPPAVQEMAAAGHILGAHIRDLYTNYRNSGWDDESIIMAARDVKAKRQTNPGRAAKVKVAEAGDVKRMRTRTEIFAMMEHIRRQIGNNLTTSALAWASGEIGWDEFHTRAARYFEKSGKVYDAVIYQEDGGVL